MPNKDKKHRSGKIYPDEGGVGVETENNSANSDSDMDDPKDVKKSLK